MTGDLFGNSEDTAPLVELDPLPDSEEGATKAQRAAFDAGGKAILKELETFLKLGTKHTKLCREYSVQASTSDEKRGTTAGKIFETAKEMDAILERLKAEDNEAAWEKFSAKA